MKISDHLLYYLSLIGILTVGLLLIYNSSGDKNSQMIIVVGMSNAYLVFGVVHHLLNHDLVAKIVIEYVLIAMLGIAAALFIFRGGFGF